jgi:phosphatidylserine/phosphatidylglycerophosphate/cardiolipin synthase-like enzyme
MNVDYHVQELLKAGVKVYKYWGEEKLGRLHAKGMIRDDEFVSVGSCNMDKMALRHNFEQNVVSRDPDFVRYVRKKLYEHDFKYSTLAKPIKNFKEKVINKIKGWITEPLDQFD